ncbi:MAG: NusG domain II-containing protein [Lachnospiraceae bacterium]|nr:NusG domain II-containing protein [Lachnospiraceae bacterium]MDE7333895.1 NusG domain II-containing protein [Lachnospiraceae bacterium]
MDKLKKDIILFLGIFFAAFLLWLIPFLLNRDASAMVTVHQDGQEIGTYPLEKEQTISIPYGEDGYNLLFISNGEASISDADCPDGLCVRQRAISHNGESIICLPHKLVIQISAGKEKELDAFIY